MPNRWLQEITKIDGVEGVFLTSNRCKIINKLGLDYSNDQLESLALRLLRTIAAFHLKSKEVSEVELYWQNQYVICKNSNGFLLVTLCKTSRVLALLRITLNVILANLMEDKIFLKLIKAHVSDKTITLKKGSFDESEKKLISRLN